MFPITKDPHPVTGDEDELTLNSLPSGIDPTIIPEDPSTWPYFYRHLVWCNNPPVLDFLRCHRIRVITPSPYGAIPDDLPQPSYYES